MANPLKRGGAPAPAPTPQTPNPAPEQKASQQSASSVETGVRASDAGAAQDPSPEGVGLLSSGADAPEAPAAPESGSPKAESSQAATSVLSGRDRAAWISDMAVTALSTPDRVPYYFDEAAKAAYHQGGGKELKSRDMKEALEVGSMVAFVRMSEANYIPANRTIQQDHEALTRNIEKRTASIKDGAASAKPEYAERAKKNAEYQLEALGVITKAGELALANGDQKGVRALNAILVGQGNTSYIGHLMRQSAGEKKDNYPLFKTAEVSQGTRGIKDPEVLLKRVKGWMSYEVTAADREQKSFDKKPVSDGLAEARARAAAATRVSHLFAVPRDFKLDQEFLAALGRKSGGAQNYKPQTPRALNTNQKAAVEELKTILSERSSVIPAELTPEISEMMESGVNIETREGEILFTVEDAKNQQELLSHMNALVGQDPAKAEEAQNYFGKMPRSRELAAAIAENL